MKTGTRIVKVVTILVLGCLQSCFWWGAYTAAPRRPIADPAKDVGYRSGTEVPIDDAIYDISGIVRGYFVNANGDAQLMGATFGPPGADEDIGFVRVLVRFGRPKTDLAPSGATIILKTEDSKVSVLMHGDEVRFRCRAQYIPVAPVRKNAVLDVEDAKTWELSRCRLATPLVSQTVEVTK